MNIGQVSAATGISQRMIRHYEAIGLIPAPSRRASGYRDYCENDLHRLRFVANARDIGFSVDEIRKLLDLWQAPGRSNAEVRALAAARADELGRKAAALEAMRATLTRLAAECAASDRPECPIIESLSQ